MKMGKTDKGRRLAPAISLAALLVAGGCVGASYVRTGAVYPARPPDCEIEVFSTVLPDRPYEEIGLVEGEGSHWKADLEDLLPKLMEEACLAGGDGIVLRTEGKSARGKDGYAVLHAVATVVRWTGGSPS